MRIHYNKDDTAKLRGYVQFNKYTHTVVVCKVDWVSSVVGQIPWVYRLEFETS